MLIELLVLIDLVALEEIRKYCVVLAILCLYVRYPDYGVGLPNFVLLRWRPCVELEDVIQISLAIIDLHIPRRDYIVLTSIKHELESVTYPNHCVSTPLTRLTFTTG
jgi:hypothetical protein